jgi:inner membrane protein
MDPVAHTLFGATLAQTRLKHLTPLAAATLMIGANLPDVDVVVSVFGSDVSLLHRRGWTHGVVAMVVLPVVLAAVMVFYDRWFRRRRDPTKEPVDPRGVLILSCLGVWSHPVLDWLNTYGVRLLMPFDGRWFYGDALFIIDPWMWLLMGATVVFAWSGGLLSKGGWAVLGGLTTALVTWAPMVPVAAKVVWWVSIGVILVARVRGVEPAANQRWAAVCVAAFFVYVGGTMAGNQVARQGVEQWLEDQGFSGAEVAMTGPVPANPFAREVVAVTEEYYLGAEVR